MATELSHSRGEDPFGSSSIFCLLPQTLGPCSNAPIAASYAEELDSIDTFFRSMVVKGSKQLVQQAQTITKSFTDSHSLYPNDEKLAAKLKDHPQERRPALGRKRATFSLKSTPSFLPNLEISSTIDHIQDPEEYFKTIQELENAEKELKKLRGEVSPGPVECHQVTTARKRRPGLLGKSASYKHHISAGDIMETSAQEVPHDRRIPSLSNTPTSMELCSEIHTEPIGETHVSQAKNRCSKLQDVAEGRDSPSGKEKNISNLLEKLLTSCKDFGGDEGNTFLRESLQMKSIDTRKICLPELGDIQISQHTASKIIARRGESPTLAKSPLEAISALQRRFPLINPLKDLYSVYPTDDAPSSGDNSLIKSRGKVSHSLVNALNHDDSGLSFDNQSSPLEESATKLDFQDEICLPVVEVGSSIGKKSISEEKHTENPHHFEVNTNPDINGVVDDRDGLADGLQEEGTDRQVDTIISNQRDVLVDGLSVGVEGLSGINQLTAQVTLEQPSQLLGTNTDCDTNQFYGLKNLSGGFDGYLHEKGNKMLQDTLNKIQPNAGESLSSSCVNCTTTECLASLPNRDLDNNCNNSGANVETGFSGYNDISQSEANVTILAKAAHTRASEDLSRPSEAATLTGQNLENIRSRPEENNEGHQTTSRAPQNEESRPKEPQRTKNKKKYTARQSLAGAGMVWENGKRRSSRHRFRPLEHWRGERLLYGRIHDSLATVIGVKYASPGKGGLKVESYVPEKYADLVAQAGRY